MGLIGNPSPLSRPRAFSRNQISYQLSEMAAVIGKDDDAAK
jgi:hypothetical protein